MRHPAGSITYILNSPVAGGLEHTILSLLRSAELQKYQRNVIFILRFDGRLLNEFLSVADTVTFCPLNWPSSNAIFPPSYRLRRWVRTNLNGLFPQRLGYLLKRSKTDIVHSHVWTRLMLQAEGILRYARLPWIYTSQGTHHPGTPDLADDVPMKLAEVMMRSATHLTAVSRRALDSWTSAAAYPSDKTHVIHNPVDTTRFTPGGVRLASWRARYNIPDDAIVFGTATRLSPEKRLDLLVNAAAILIGENLPTYFIIAGEGVEHSHLDALIKTKGLVERIRLIGFQEDVPAFLRELDVFVLTSATEGFSVALVEACAVGLACISTNVGGAEELLGEDAGIVVPPESVEALVDAMKRMLVEDVRKNFGAKASENAHRYSVDKIAQDYTALYQQVLHSSS